MSFLLIDLFLVALVLHDRNRLGRVHPGTWTGIIVTVPLHTVSSMDCNGRLVEPHCASLAGLIAVTASELDRCRARSWPRQALSNQCVFGYVLVFTINLDSRKSPIGGARTRSSVHRFA